MAPNMKRITFIIGLLLSCSVGAGNLSEWLKNTNPEAYFPMDADYVTYQNVCNENACFNLVAVHYITPTNKGMRRLAAFSQSGAYLGVYSGFNEMPIKLVGNKLLFPKSELGSSINFTATLPPEMAYIDGEYFEFEAKPEQEI